MKIVSINSQLLRAFEADREFMRKKHRPCVLIMRLTYKGKKRTFAVPLRSNISSNTPKVQYFPLPPRSTTRPPNHHGIHYIKIFPVSRRYLIRYRTDGNIFEEMIKSVIEKNQKEIVCSCQNYLDAYAAGDHPKFSTDIDLLISILDSMD